MQLCGRHASNLDVLCQAFFASPQYHSRTQSFSRGGSAPLLDERQILQHIHGRRIPSLLVERPQITRVSTALSPRSHHSWGLGFQNFSKGGQSFGLLQKQGTVLSHFDDLLIKNVLRAGWNPGDGIFVIFG